MGWKDKAFEAKMKDMGWWQTAPWCMLFVRLVWNEAYKYFYDSVALKAIININLTASSIGSVANIQKYKDFEFSDKPQVGAVCIWKKTSTTGHGAIVVKVNNNSFQTVEGNTNSAGSREGDKVLSKTRTYNISSMKILGFLIPKVF